MITLRGQGFGTYDAAAKVVFEGGGVTLEAATPYVWRDDLIQVRVPVGERINGIDVPMPATDLTIKVEVGAEASNTLPFQLISIPPAAEGGEFSAKMAVILSFQESTEISNNRDISTFLGSPNHNLARTKDAEVGDVNGDGLLDLVDNNSNNETNSTHGVLRINSGAASFSATLLEPLSANDEGKFATQVPGGGDYFGNHTTYDADFIDLDNDSFPDLVQTASNNTGGAGSTGHRLRVLMNNGSAAPGTFLEDSSSWLSANALGEGRCPDDLAHVDVNRDGFVDVLVALRTAPGFCSESTSQTLLFLNQGGTTFSAPIVLTAPNGTSTHDAFFVDANMDRWTDIVLCNETGAGVQIFLHNGSQANPGFNLGTTLPFTAAAGETADFNGDGAPDLALANTSSARVYLNDPNNPGSFTSVTLPGGNFPAYDVELGDLDLDGTVDILAAGITAAAASTLRVWLNDGAGTFSHATDGGAGVLFPGIGPYQRLSVDLLDFDVDGDLDLYLTGADGQNVGPAGGFGRVPNQFFENLVIDEPLPPVVTRPDGNFPDYEIGDLTILDLVTELPAQPNQPVFGWRVKNGQVERNGEEVGTTDGNGVFHNELTITDLAACGEYSGEEFAVGAIDNPRSEALEYTINCPPEATRPDGNFPDYELGDITILRLETDPPRPNQTVYTWRFKDGQLERNGLALGQTDQNGVFVNQLTITDPNACGEYTGEEFAVGAINNPRSEALEYTITCGPNAPSVTRIDGNFPDYELGDVAILRLDTDPPQANETVYTWRFKNGQLERSAFPLGITDQNGVFVNQLTITDPNVCGTYSGERFAVGSPTNPRSTAQSYTVTCPPEATRPDGNFPNYVLGDTAILRIETVPPRPNQPIYTWRFFNGQLQRNGDFLGTTDQNGVFVNQLTITVSGTCGSYSGEQFAVGSVNDTRSAPLAYTISCPQ